MAAAGSSRRPRTYRCIWAPAGLGPGRAAGAPEPGNQTRRCLCLQRFLSRRRDPLALHLGGDAGLAGRCAAPFTATIGHHPDVGGRVPGSIAADAMSVFEEGIRIPATRIRRGGEIDQGVMRLIAENSRQPEERTLDLQAQIAAGDLGARELLVLVEQVGFDVVAEAVDDILAYTARRLKNRIA